MSRYDFEAHPAGAALFAPAAIALVGSLEYAELPGGVVRAAADVEPQAEVTAMLPVAFEPEPLGHLRPPIATALAGRSPGPAASGRVSLEPRDPQPLSPPVSTEIALRPATRQAVEPPPRLSLVAEQADTRTVRLRPVPAPR